MGDQGIITEENLERLYDMKIRKITEQNGMYIIPVTEK
jgi:hypothetical protein